MLSQKWQKLIRSLHKKKYRQSQGLFLVEGEKVVCELLNSDWPIEQLLISPAFAEAHQDLLAQRTLDPWVCEPAHISALSHLHTNEQALALVPLPEPANEAPHPSPWLLALDQINDPGNLGTLIRLADWFGMPDLVCSPQCVDAFSPKVISASKGSFLRVRIHHTALTDYLDQLPAHCLKLGADLQGDSLHQLQLPPQAQGVLLLGSESHGLSEPVLQRVSQRITIPGSGQAESLNVAIAAAIICDNLFRLTGFQESSP